MKYSIKRREPCIVLYLLFLPLPTKKCRSLEYHHRHSHHPVPRTTISRLGSAEKLKATMLSAGQCHHQTTRKRGHEHSAKAAVLSTYMPRSVLDKDALGSS